VEDSDASSIFRIMAAIGINKHVIKQITITTQVTVNAGNMSVVMQIFLACLKICIVCRISFSEI
jgi:hypothetical protein